MKYILIETEETRIDIIDTYYDYETAADSLIKNLRTTILKDGLVTEEGLCEYVGLDTLWHIGSYSAWYKREGFCRAWKLIEMD